MSQKGSGPFSQAVADPAADPILATPLQFLKGVGPRRAADFEHVGLVTVEDLLYRFPLRYEDRSRLLPIGSLKPGTAVRVIQQIAARNYTWTSDVRGVVVEYRQKQTGSWFAHAKDDKLWLDRLTLRIWTDGTITPSDAVTQSAKILVDQFRLFNQLTPGAEEPLELPRPVTSANTFSSRPSRSMPPATSRMTRPARSRPTKAPTPWPRRPSR